LNIFHFEYGQNSGKIGDVIVSRIREKRWSP
jgi:hypothetical protein